MKFAKRLDAEASRCWKSSYFNYKAVKQSIKQEVQGAGAYVALLPHTAEGVPRGAPFFCLPPR